MFQQIINLGHRQYHDIGRLAACDAFRDVVDAAPLGHDVMSARLFESGHELVIGLAESRRADHFDLGGVGESGEHDRARRTERRQNGNKRPMPHRHAE